MNIHELAARYNEQMTRKTRDSGAEYWVIKNGAPDHDDIQTLAREAHDGMLPDDYKYQFIVEALDAIEEADSEEEARVALEHGDESRFHILTGWLHAGRIHYLDEAIDECAIIKGVQGWQLLANGYQREREEVFAFVLNSLHAIADQLEGA